MKKVIFISALAIAAAVSCTKSDIVDTKFDDAIGFENYLGRPAQTKASVATSFVEAGIYGFYTGSQEWAVTADQTGDAYVASPKANLWVDDVLKYDGTVTPEKFWANADDHYSFLAYAPKGNGNIKGMPTGDNVTNPTITFEVPTVLTSQTDLLYANVLNVNKPTTTGDKIAMPFHHALSRLTINAKAAADQKFDFRVKKITLAGGFQKSATLTLKDGSWSTNGAPATETETYTFYENATNNVALSAAQNTSYANSFAADGTVATANNNYLMMIPVDFSEIDTATEKFKASATLTVEYTTYRENVESTVSTVTLPVNTKFMQGKAYAINLVFSKTAEPIAFTVTVKNWDDAEDDNADDNLYDDGEFGDNDESQIEGGNPVNGEGWTDVTNNN